MAFDLTDILGALRFGPENTMQADPSTPSIYASEEEWAAYRQQQEAQKRASAGNAATTGRAAGDPYYTQQLFAPDSVKLESLSQHAVNGPRGLSPEEIQALSSPVSSPTPSSVTAQPKHKKQDQLNENWNSSGIQAFTDEKGQLVLTNKPGATSAKDAMTPFTPEQIAAVRTSNPTTSGNVNSILSSLKDAKDYATAAGIAISLNESIGLETARIQGDAVKFAEQALGIPQLRQSLVQSEAIDAQVKDQWGRPAMGDSPATKNLRARVQQAEQLVQRKAEQWLAQNSQFASLKSAATSAKVVLEEKQRVFSQVEAKQLATQTKQEAKDAQALDVLEVQPPHTFDRLSKLNPQINSSENPRQAAAKYLSLRGNDKQFVEAVVNATEEDLPALAVRGNQYARQLTIAREMGATGQSAEKITSLLDQVARATLDSAKLQEQYIAMTTPAGADKKEYRAQALTQLNSAKLSAEGKNNETLLNSNLAIQLVRMGATQRFTDDVAGWNSSDPLVQAAVKKAAETTGKADISAVWTALVGDKTGPEAIALTRLLQAEATKNAAKYKSSLFGAPNTLEIDALLSNMVKTRTSWWAELTGKSQQTYGPVIRNSPQTDSPFVFR